MSDHLHPLFRGILRRWDRRTDPRPYHAYYDSGEERARKAGEEADPRLYDLAGLLRSIADRVEAGERTEGIVDACEECREAAEELLP